jgi:thiamine-phosphate pyrophosphorylase
VRLERASRLLALCRRYHTPMIVNDDPDLALEAGADGVHVGEEDASCRAARERLGPDALVGVSCYDSLDAALQAQGAGADYVAFGAFFPTATKAPRARATPDLLRAAAARLELPIAAIGGITAANARPLVAAGASLLAVVSALYGREDPGAAAREFAPLFAASRCEHG